MKRSSPLIWFLAFPWTLLAQGASPYLFNLPLESEDVDLSWEGYWRFRLRYGTGYAPAEKGDLYYVSPFPELAQGFSYLHEPDFKVRLLLYNRYFLEASFTQGYDKNSFALGYQGDGSSSLQELRLGNFGITMGEYESLRLGAPQYASPGIKARFTTQNSEHEFIVRYEQADLLSKEFRGPYEVEVETLSLPSYRQGRDFILPHIEISTPEVYQETSEGGWLGGDGRRYGKAPFKVDQEKGILSLLEPPQGRVLVYYPELATVNPSFIMPPDGRGQPDPRGTLQPFGWGETDPYWGGTFQDNWQVNLEGKEALLVYNPGEYSHFQLYNSYYFYKNLPPEGWRTTIGLYNEDGTLAEKSRDFLFLEDISEEEGRRFLRVLQREDRDPRNPLNRIPFQELHPGLYGPLAREVPPSQKIQIVIRKDNKDYYLGTNVAPDSVRAFINGMEDRNVRVEGGSLRFSRPIFPEDKILVLYKVESLGFGRGQIVVGQGNRVYLNKAVSFELTESFQWSLPGSSLSYSPGENPGQVDLGATFLYQSQDMKASIGGTLGVYTPDTAGTLRVLGMEKGGFPLYLSSKSLVPPEKIPPGGVTGSYSPLIYKDYGGSRGEIKGHNWPGAQGDSSREGPWVAAAEPEDPFQGLVMGMTYQMGDNTWSGGDLLPQRGELVDLSFFRELVFYAQRRNLGQDQLTLSLFIGENGEGGDHNANGILEGGDPRLILEKPIDLAPFVEGSWREVRVPLSTEERKRLSRVRSLRFLLQSSGGASQGELLIGGLRGEASPLEIVVWDGAVAVDQERVSALEVLDPSLEVAFPEVGELLNQGKAEQRVFRLQWSGRAPQEKITGRTWFSPVPAEDYGELVLFLKNAEPGGQGEFSITDSRGQGIFLSYTPGAEGQWEKLVFDLKRGTASFSGNSKVDELKIDPKVEEFSQVVFSRSGLSEGTLFVDELHFQKPSFLSRGQLEVRLDHQRKGPLLSTAEGTLLVGNLEFDSRLLYTAKTGDSYFSQEKQRLEGQFSQRVDLGKLRVETDWKFFQGEGFTNYDGAHRLRFPANNPRFWLKDSYSRSFRRGDNFMSRTNHIYWAPLGKLRLEAQARGQAVETELLQSWGGKAVYQGSSFQGDWGVTFYQASPWNQEEGGYWKLWVKDFNQLLPQGRGLSREGRTSLNLSRTWGILNLKLDTQLAYQARPESSWVQENSWYSDISALLAINRGPLPFQLRSGYRRRLRQKIYPGESKGFEADIKALSNLSRTFPLWNFTPLYEVFSPDSLENYTPLLIKEDDLEYSPRLYINLFRSPQSSLWDILLPSAMDISFEKGYYRKQDSLYSLREWEIQIDQRVGDLFGQGGRHRIFSFYRTEEWGNSFQISMREYGGNAFPRLEAMVYQTYFSLWGKQNTSFTLDNRFTRNWKLGYRQNAFQFILQWSKGRQKERSIPFLKGRTSFPSYWKHEERLLLEAYSKEVSGDRYKVILRHETNLVFVGLGALQGWVALGWGDNPELFRNATELGLEFELRF